MSSVVKYIIHLQYMSLTLFSTYFLQLGSDGQEITATEAPVKKQSQVISI